jgi:hypothetical protein
MQISRYGYQVVTRPGCNLNFFARDKMHNDNLVDLITMLSFKLAFVKASVLQQIGSLRAAGRKRARVLLAEKTTRPCTGGAAGVSTSC